jgi:hypothetical protein
VGVLLHTDSADRTVQVAAEVACHRTAASEVAAKSRMATALREEGKQNRNGAA